MQEPESVLILLPLPPKALSPNSRTHWRKLARYRKKYRTAGRYATLEAGGQGLGWEKARITCTFFFRTNRRRDTDNADASMKSAIDGIRDAGLIVDDHASVLAHGSSRFEIDRDRPRVEVLVERV